VAAGGIEACKYIEETGPYDIYFIDWKMPGMNGIELSRRINEYETNKSVIIMISATDWNLIEDEAREVGVSKFLQKPLFASAVADCINQCLGMESDVLGGNEKQDVIDCFAGYKLMLVEDVEINREILISVLEPTALEIICAENGLEAVEMFGAAPGDFDMIFMDVHMPEMDGYEATRHIRAMEFEYAKEIPIVAMTANVFREDIEKCLAAGMNDHIGKPLSFDEVMQKLWQYLPSRQRKMQAHSNS
jgi:CheY-like chemotaxis protein